MMAFFKRLFRQVEEQVDAQVVKHGDKLHRQLDAPFLDKKRTKVELREIEELSHDVIRLEFALPGKNMPLGLPTGKHIKIFAPNMTGKEEGKWNGRDDPEAGRDEIERKYTPTSNADTVGHFELIVKVYKAGVKENFPDGGKMSQYLASLKVGDWIDIQGPFGLYEYVGQGQFNIRRKISTFKNIGMIAGGTGITPMLQVIAAITEDPEDHTSIHLLFANQTEGDIFLREQLEAIQAKHPHQFKLHYTVDRAPEGWAYSTGFVNEEMIREHMPTPGPDTVVLMCGPPPMIKFACRPNLTTVGHAEECQIDF
eukprot:CAMPEP_0184528878 /NCGR_PEP_ID=MMETSP0198_2-20121128/12041_1 /TAXON_ID=1112570 /ORGANISM="Thraustochytrium sp., Strain LLF1b" /LENGTH=310 /DNA_ID=CAMNT_0026920783 /DNA_START=152 /DNA_END=1084 /DNA_ORIENTATION=-